MERGKDFCRHFAEFFGPAAKRFPDYVHLMYKHADWFWGLDADGKLVGPPAWWSTTALEKSHSKHKRKLRYKTCKGMPLKMRDIDGNVFVEKYAPHIKQLFMWQFRTYTWRWNLRQNGSVDMLKKLSITDIVNLYQCFDFPTNASDPLTESEINYLLGLPKDCKLHLTGRGCMDKSSRQVHVQVTYANQAAIDKITRWNAELQLDNCVTCSALLKKHHAQFKRSPEVVAREKKARLQHEQARVRQQVESTNLDMSFFTKVDGYETDDEWQAEESGE
jgi:hypothetical protein